MNVNIQRALISVSDKTDLIPLVQCLEFFNIEILSTGGTAKFLQQQGFNIREISDFTGFPEIMDGRVKTLHPNVFAGILGRRDTDHEVMNSMHLAPIDLVIVNLYPFQKTIQNPECSLAEAIENIDIGGPSLVRAAAKNHQWVTVVIDPKDYPKIQNNLKSNQGAIDFELRKQLAHRAFTYTADYDAHISRYLSQKFSPEEKFPKVLQQTLYKVQDLRYGENPHQNAALYSSIPEETFFNSHLLQGKALSYNNLLDANIAWQCVNEFKNPSCVIVKHTIPCGIASSESLLSAYNAAFEADTISAYGGIIAFNTPVDSALLQHVLSKQFVEMIIAPEFTGQINEIKLQKPQLRLLQAKPLQNAIDCFEYRSLYEGKTLLQTYDNTLEDAQHFRCVSKRSPTDREWDDLHFAWKIIRYVTSNAIVLVGQQKTLGIGSGQTSRIDSTRIAINKAKEFHQDITNAVLASDAFFPFADNLEIAAQWGVTAVIHPGGSIHDEAIITAADRLNLAMIMTGIRHFKH